MAILRENVLVWTALHSPGEPTCLVGSVDRGLSVDTYHRKDGSVKGVVVFDNDGNVLSIVGKVPKVALEDFAR